MVTDPVEQIQQHWFESPYVHNLPRVLNRLAALPPSTETPYLTLSLDWRPDGSNPSRRTGKIFFDQQVDAFLDQYKSHTPPKDSLSDDLGRIRSYLEREVDPAARGLVIVACSAKNVFVPVLLPVPIPNRFAAAPTPSLLELVKLAEDEPRYAVLHADQREATLLLIDQETRQQSLEVKSNDYPQKQKQGGWSQRRFQQRADERVEAHVRAVAEEVRKDLDRAGIDRLVLAGEERIKSMLTDALHQSIRNHIVGSIHLDIRASAHQVIEASRPVIERAERVQEAAMVQHVKNGAGPGGGAVTGPVETLTAIQTGQVRTLVMTDDFSARGWADYTMPMYGAGNQPREHPAGGDVASTVPIALEDELVRLAIQIDAEIEIVRTAVPTTTLSEQATLPAVSEPIPRTAAARELDQLGGVGAILRYALTTDQSTAEL